MTATELGCDCAPAPADGNPNTFPLTGTNFSANGGLSGIKYIGRTMFLIGVFLDGAEPTGTAPATLDYSVTSPLALTVSPLLRQLFFIGDGLGTGGANQHFMVPTGATRLFLGFADGVPYFRNEFSCHYAQRLHRQHRLVDGQLHTNDP